MVEDIEGEPKVDREGKCFKMAEAQECGRKRQEMKTEEWLESRPGSPCQAIESCRGDGVVTEGELSSREINSHNMAIRS